MKQKKQKQKGNAKDGHRLSDMLSRTARVIPWAGGGLFALFALFMLAGMNSDYLYTVQERSLFLPNRIFFDELTATPGGFIRWVGCWFTQFFYYPTWGSTLLILLWLALYAVTLRTFRLRREWSILALVPVFALLCSVIDLGYWLYYIKIQGYWFSETLSYLTVMLAVWGSTRIRHHRLHLVCLTVWTVLGYPVLGWYALFGSLLMALCRVCGCHGERPHKVWQTLCATALLLVATPLLWYHHYTQMRLQDAWSFGFPTFQADSCTSWITSVPFIVAALWLLLLPLTALRRQGTETSRQTTGRTVAAGMVLMILCVAVTWVTNFSDYNYHAEMRMYRYTAEGKWNEVLDEATDLPCTPTRQMVMLKNIALMNTGELGSRAYHFDNGGLLPHTRDELKVHMVHTAAPLFYYQYGKLNFATRWSIENGVEYGFKVNDLKLLARCALITGETEAARKYLALLEQTTFHAEEARALRQMADNPALLDNDKSSRCVRELYRHSGSMLDSDNGQSEIYLLHYFANTMNVDSKLLQEVTLNYAMVSKDIRLFWPRFFQYATLHKGEEIPIHYQEAAYLYGTLENAPFIKNMPFDRKRITVRYLYFQQKVQNLMRSGLSEKQAGEAVRAEFGDTFWWFYFFCNDVNSY